MVALLFFTILLTATHAKRHALLIRLASPTLEQQRRVCGLVSEAAATDFAFPVYLLDFRPDDTALSRDGGMCDGLLPTAVVTQAVLLADGYKNDTVDIFSRKAYSLAHFQEIWWHRRHWQRLKYDFLWTLEADVGWRGNLFDGLASFANWPEDLLCSHIGTKVVGGDWGRNWGAQQSCSFKLCPDTHLSLKTAFQT